MDEMRLILHSMLQALERLPDRPINVDNPKIILPGKTDAMTDMESMIHHFKLVMEGIKVPPGENWYSVESSKGEHGRYVISEHRYKPVRWRVRGQSFVNLSALLKRDESRLIDCEIALNASL